MISEFEQGAKRRAQILARLKELADAPDKQKAHIEADELLCEYLRIVGAKDIVEAFQAITKYSS